ncbi:inositol monophosphatase family protein [Kitasatospora sp. SUK 42]|uniref:inositol monophosphatase family protein n=1 Tax=Kitasatospora sp. SUK 42 TaxID=1588882 RepID=UPI0027E281E2|nr:inositol monophosphatase family protein [Kitasatospora sp. SUK 42]
MDLLTLATEVAREGAAYVRGRAGEAFVVATKSSELDVVTATDREAEALIRDALLAARPLDGFLGEESGHRPGSSGLTWIVDPIDGTVNHLYRSAPCAVSVAVVSGWPGAWTAEAGAVVTLPAGEVFAAARGRGATLDGRPLRASGETRLGRALVSTGLAYDRAARARQLAVLAELAPDVRDVRMSGSACADLCAVAAGRLDGYYERGLGPWDHAAGALIAREAGAVVEGPGGGPPDGELVLAAAPGIAAALRRAVG